MIHKAKKSLGQNFLKSEIALNMMCEAGEVNNKDTILEIGPGKGALTSKLLLKASKVIAVEKDRELFEFLKEKFINEIKNKKLELINDDILNIETKTYHIKTKKYKLIANIPYNITGAIFKKFLSNDFQPEKMVLLVQKEVADRIVAKRNSNKNITGKESILSLSVKVYGNPKYIMKVHKRFFSPSPKVDSAIISISEISKNNFAQKEKEDLFFKIIKTGFAHKRKILQKNFESLEVGLPKIREVFEKLGIDSKIRAEDVSIDKWLEISNLLSTDL